MVPILSPILTNIRLFGKNRWATLFLLLSFLLNIAIWLAIYRFAQSSDDFVPLHYSTVLGIDRIGQWEQLFYMPAIGRLVILLHFLFSVLFRRERIVPDVLMSGAFLLQVMLTLSTGFLLYNFF